MLMLQENIVIAPLRKTDLSVKMLGGGGEACLFLSQFSFANVIPLQLCESLLQNNSFVTVCLRICLNSVEPLLMLCDWVVDA